MWHCRLICRLFCETAAYRIGGCLVNYVLPQRLRRNGEEYETTKQRHKHKESFSVLLIPNTGGKSRQFHVSRFSFRLGVGVLGVILLAVAGAAAWTGFQFTRQENVRRQVTQQKETIETLEAQMAGTGAGEGNAFGRAGDDAE